MPLYAHVRRRIPRLRGERPTFTTVQHHAINQTSWISAVRPVTGTGPTSAPAVPPSRPSASGIVYGKRQRNPIVPTQKRQAPIARARPKSLGARFAAPCGTAIGSIATAAAAAPTASRSPLYRATNGSEAPRVPLAAPAGAAAITDIRHPLKSHGGRVSVPWLPNCRER